MWKLKNELNFDILEKYGYTKNEPYNYIKYLIDKPNYIDYIQIDLITREITRHIKSLYEAEIKCKKVANSYIQDLVSANLIEKGIK